jgi:FkbM family methyltransferase
MRTETIDGPLGPFVIPSEPPELREHMIKLSRDVWAGEYDSSELPSFAGGAPGIIYPQVLDIGACIGAFAVWARAKWPQARIRCFEPNHAAWEILAADNATFARVYRRAITVADRATLSTHDAWAWGSMSTFHDYGPGEEVPSFHPRDLPGADVLKIDAEGVELEILEAYPYLDGLSALIYEYHFDQREACEKAVRARAPRLRQVRDDGGSQGVSIWVR